VSEELGEAASAGARWEDALLVVAELGEDEVEVAVALVPVDLGEELGLGPAGASSPVPRARNNTDGHISRGSLTYS
jgi:hypothetical protein